MKTQPNLFRCSAIFRIAFFPAFFAFALSATAAPGDYDASFDSQTAVSGAPYALALQPDGKVLLGGTFTNVGGDDDYICRLNPDGSLDADFDPADLLNEAVYAIAVQPDGKILVGGNFTDVGGDDDFVCRLNPDGSHDASFDPDDLLNEDVRCIVIRPDGKIFIGGQFTLVGGTDYHICRLNADGSHDTGFAPGGTIGNGSVQSIAVQPDGKLVIGGGFLNAGGVDDFVCRLNADGSHDVDFNPNSTLNNVVYSAILQPNGKVLVCGGFTDAGGDDDYICRFNADGTHDTNFDPKSRLANLANSIILQADGKVLVGGFFDDAPSGSGGDDKVCRLRNGGAYDSTFAVGDSLNSTVFGLTLQLDGKVLASGIFSSAPSGTGDDQRAARLFNDPATSDLTVPSGSEVTWELGGAAPEPTRVSFSYSTDGGTSWVTLGEGARVSGGWELTGVSIPSAATVRAHGFISGGYYAGSSGIVEAAATAPNNPSGGGGGPADTWSSYHNLALTYYQYYASFGLYDYATAFYYYYYGIGDFYFYAAYGNQALADFSYYNGFALYFLYLYGTAGYSSYYYYLAFAYYYYFVGVGDFNSANLYYNAYISAAFGG